MGTDDWVLKGTKLVTYIKAKIKNLEQSLDFQKYNVKKKKKKKEEREKKKSHKNYKENIGTKLITTTKKHKLKIQSSVWNFRNTMLKKEEEKERDKKKSQKILKIIQVQN